MPNRSNSPQESGADIVLATTIAGTSERFVNPVAAELASRGHRIHLVTGDRPAQADYPHTSIVIPMQRGVSPRQDLESIRRWASYLRALKPQMIVTGTPKASLLGLTAARLSGVPTRVYVIHGAVWDGASGFRRRLLERAERRTIGASTHQLAVSDSLARLVHARGLSPRMPDVLGSGSFCGVDVQRFQPASSVNRSESVMCFVGRLNRDKGVDVLLRTLDRVREKVDASLTILGDVDWTAPPDKATMVALASHPHVNWVGAVEDVATHLQGSAILVFPTAREGLPQVPLEAQACGIPVVSWRATGVIDAVRDGFTGVLVRYGDETALAAAAVQLLTDQGLHGRASSNARVWVMDRFDSRVVASRTARYLDHCLTDPDGSTKLTRRTITRPRSKKGGSRSTG